MRCSHRQVWACPHPHDLERSERAGRGVAVRRTTGRLHMRRILVGAAVALIAATGVARAQSHGPYTSAEILPMNGHVAGAYLQTSDSAVGVLSQLRLSFYPG